MRNVGYIEGSLLTSDGCVAEIGVLSDSGCCPPDICNLDPCALMCSFIELLPNGPLWDRAKAQGMDLYRDVNDPCAGTCEPTRCSSLVDYAAYSGYRLHGLIQGALWAALRESDPYTAVDTIDSLLDFYGWENPWNTLCRDQRLGPSPLECQGWQPDLNNCDANFSPIYVPTVPADLERAVNRGIVLALSRLQMGPIKNLCGINWVIEPLGAELHPVISPPPDPEHPCCSRELVWEICNRSQTIEALPSPTCTRGSRQINAWFEIPELSFDTATGTCSPTGPGTIRLWPGIMAAQSIALSMLPSNGTCHQPIIRCETLDS